MRLPAALAISFALVGSVSCVGRRDSPLRPTPAPPVGVERVEPQRVEPQREPERRMEPEPRVEHEPGPREPNPYVVPPVRQAGDLTVEAPPRPPSERFGARLRNHVDGGLSKGSPRVWVGPQVPWFVPLMEGQAELFLLDRVGDEFMAFYREPYGASSCGLGDDANCHYLVRLYDIEGQVRWSVALHELLSAPTYLEVQDIRWADGTLYFNEACQSYASGAKGRCSALVAYDPMTQRIRWRTRPLVSNGLFLVHGDYIVAGYGFTAERDFIHVVRRSDGEIVQRLAVTKAPQGFALGEDGLLEVTLYPGTLHTYALQGWDGPDPKLVRKQRPAASGR